MTFDEVRACLEKDGWPTELLSEVTLRSRFRSGDRVFPLFVHLESGSPPDAAGDDGALPGRSRALPQTPRDDGALPQTPRERPDPRAVAHPAYATFAVIPFARLPSDESGDVLAERLLVLNREMNMAKFSVDEDADVILSVEYPLDDLDPSEVRDALDVLSFYAEKYRAEIQSAAAAATAE